MPKIWTEHKLAPLWADVRFCLDAKMVVDLPLGSGVVARAAMQPGIEYLACCPNDKHALWMLSIVDSEACSLICLSLVDVDRVALIDAHFADVMVQISHRARRVRR